jgi:hypothetical protein
VELTGSLDCQRFLESLNNLKVQPHLLLRAEGNLGVISDCADYVFDKLLFAHVIEVFVRIVLKHINTIKEA